MTHRGVPAALAVAAPLGWVRGADAPVVARWVEDSYEDFAGGRVEAAGHNLFVSRDGKVRTIRRSDLDGDGDLDRVFNSTHDTGSFVPAVAASVGPDRSVSAAPLAVESALWCGQSRYPSPTRQITETSGNRGRRPSSGSAAGRSDPQFD